LKLLENKLFFKFFLLKVIPIVYFQQKKPSKAFAYFGTYVPQYVFREIDIFQS